MDEETMSEDSFDIQETADLMRGHKISYKNGKNGHVIGEVREETVGANGTVQTRTGVVLDHQDSGVESITNGDSQESIGLEAATNQLINIKQD